MKRLKLISAVAVVLAASTMLYLATTVNAQGTTITTVQIDISVSNGQIHLSQNPVIIHGDQQVSWDCPDGCTWAVKFVGTGPFAASGYSNAHNTNKKTPVPSGKPTHGPGTYKYSVKVGNVTWDPQIIVR